ncbi:hypothetical protein [Rhizobium sp. M1]|uniref:hypothetical protein n=1 Tax=Rhizobium sp. M1 TaxID=2035453 RepID=UPI000BEA624F|nr:hypothetical protein [Rhizobium sp. M1]PDT10203.1 hypothetical protein CO655_14590 [Rhizobium sp. M1]
MLNIKCTIKNASSANEAYDWRILGPLINECVRGSISLGADIEAGFEFQDLTKSEAQPVRTFGSTFKDQHGTPIWSWFAFTNEWGLDPQAAIVRYPTTETDEFDLHVEKYPLD